MGNCGAGSAKHIKMLMDMLSENIGYLRRFAFGAVGTMDEKC